MRTPVSRLVAANEITSTATTISAGPRPSPGIESATRKVAAPSTKAPTPWLAACAKL